MERLTRKNKDGSVYQPVTTSIAAAFTRLAKYEDTGLSPEEVKALADAQERPNNKEGEWLTYEDESGRKRHKCSICNMPVARNSQKSKFCPNCGSRLIPLDEVQASPEEDQ